MKFKHIFIIAIACISSIAQAEAQSCRELYREAVSLQKEGRLDKAKAKFQQVVACGDNLYIDDSRSYIAWIERVQRKYNPVKPFAVSDNEVVIPYQGGQDVITVDGNGSWQARIIDGDNGWCKIKKEKGKVVIYSEPNEDSQERSCEVVVTMGGKSQTVKITNASAPERLEPSAKSISFPSQGETHSIEIQANTDWEVKDVPGWVVSSKEDGNITLTALANDNNVDRQADIKIEGGTKSVIINIYQGAGLDHLAFSKNDLHFSADGGDEYINVYTDAANWQLGGFPHWCQVTKVADNLLKVHCTPNEPNDLTREASVNVTTGKQMLGINVSQDARPIIHIIPQDGIGGRRISFGFAVGYLMPVISTGASSDFVFSPVNYAQGNEREQASYSSSGGIAVSAFTDIRLYKNLYLNAGLTFNYYKYHNSVSGNLNMSIPINAQYYIKGEMQSAYKENYTMTTLDLPVLASYRFPITNRSHLRINAGPVLSVGLSSKLDFSGKSDAGDMRAYKLINMNYTNQPYNEKLYSSHLNYNGSFDMYSNEADLVFHTSDGFNGEAPSTKYHFDAAPYNRINLGLKFGLGYEFMGISLDVSYQLMVTNMANGKYWGSDRWKVFNNATTLMNGYSQRNNLLQVTIGYTFRY